MGLGNQQQFGQDLLTALNNHQSLTLLQKIFIFVMVAIPGPVEWKLAFFSVVYSVTSILPFPLLVLAVALPVIGFFVIKKLLLIRYYESLEYTYLLIKPPHDSTQSTFSTAELFTVIHSLGRQLSFREKFLGWKKLISCELISTKEEGIRYILRVPKEDSEIIRKSLYAYLPEIVIEEVQDYLPADINNLSKKNWGFTTFKLSGHFLLPLQSQTALSEHDPMSFITAHMTNLKDGELVSLQLVLTPITNQAHKRISKKIRKIDSLLHSGFDISEKLEKKSPLLTTFKYLFTISKVLFLVAFAILLLPFAVLFVLLSVIMRGKIPFVGNKKKSGWELSEKQRYLQEIVGEKIGEELFEGTVRVLAIQKDSRDVNRRINGVSSALSVFNNGGYQSFSPKQPIPFFEKLSYLQVKRRLLSFTSNPILSVTEASSLYHLPFSTTTKTEDLVSSRSKTLPTPLALKQAGTELDVVFARNTYGGKEVPIGLTLEERRRHSYILGATGTGKSTLLLSMINEDLKNGKGLAIVDPHGDLAESVLACIPEDRVCDVMYFNPDDLDYPIGLNLLELTPGLDENDALREKEFVTESVVSLFRKVFSDNLNTNPHRIEYILRNTIYTAFTVPNPTIFTVYDLLNDQDFRNSVTKNLADERLVKFWKNEFGKSGNWQKVKMISPVTSRIGRFLFSPSARKILEQPKSTINFDEILNEGKILVCDLSKGKIGEDTSQVLGITILNKIQLAALKRARMPQDARKDFFLYVDEFQNFATTSFIGMLSEARKYRLDITMAEQSTSQQTRDLVNVILANVGTTIMFRSANPEDEEAILPQFYPHVEKGEIANLPAFHFFMKSGALNPDRPFSGETIPIDVSSGKDLISRMIEASRNKYGVLSPKEEEVTKPLPGKGKVSKTLPS